MGKAARWLRGLLGGGKKQDQGKEQRRATTANAPPPPPENRKRWSFCKSTTRHSTEEEEAAGRGNAAIARFAEAAWVRSLYRETEREQSKHAIAVAAATAAAADAAVAAAQAAVEVVRLTSQGPASSGFVGAVSGRAAAVKIQTAFRGFLAKKALQALKALVKLQALVRGYLVRKQAAATLQSMQALVRAQALLRTHHLPPVRPRFSLQERYADDARSEHGGAAAYSRRLSASIESSSAYGCDRSPKIVEMDVGRPKSRSSSLRTSPPLSEDLYACPVSSPFHHLPGGAPPRIAVRAFPDYDWCGLEKVRPATAQNTPRCCVNVPVTPAKSACGYNSPSSSSLLLNCPSYMCGTQSSEAKVRSQSAPKGRPEQRKRVPLSEVVLEARASLSGVGMQRSCNRVQEAFNFKKAVVSRFDRSSEAAERERDVFLQKAW